MWGYIARRCLEMGVALILMSIVVFVLGRATGDPVSLLLSDYASDEDRARVTRELGLDKPLVTQYVTFVGNVLQGNFGESLLGEQRPAVEMVLERFPASLKLAAVALLISLTIGVPLGVAAAVNYGTHWDTSARLLALLGQSIPAFWLGLVLMYFFSVKLGWLPTSGVGGWQHYVLPATTLGLFTTAAVTRLIRGSMAEALGSEYIKFLRIKGLREWRVVWKHALRNSVIPVLTFMGTFFATMITGAVVVETVFSWPGVGRLAFEAILNRDFPVIQTVVLFMTALFIGVNLLVDVAYAWVDPRIRVSKT